MRGECFMSTYLKKAREPISSYTHFIGAIVSAAGSVLLFIKAYFDGVRDFSTLLALCAFCLSLILLYTASSVYHFSNGSDKLVLHLRRLDHSMIYVLIAGTYTPILLCYLSPPKSYTFVIVMWAVALAGIVLKICWFGAPRWLGTLLYLLMGWAILADVSVFSKMGVGALIFLVLGGVSYTAGGIMYAIKKPNISKKLGFHELFHLFVLGGSLFHYLLVFFYVA